VRHAVVGCLNDGENFLDETRITLLDQLSAGTEAAWNELDTLYRPLIFGWLRRFDFQLSDQEDLTQDVMSKLHREIKKFEHNGRVGAFRSWLKTITANQARDFIRSGRFQPKAIGDSTFQAVINQLDDPNSDASREFDRQHDAFVVRRMLDAIKPEFEESTLEAFTLHVLSGLSASEVAEQMGTTTGNVYVAKSRVLRRLRERVGNWSDEFPIV
jgi:RNA polymerase sigma-70 factor, ECF subfamily